MDEVTDEVDLYEVLRVLLDHSGAAFESAPAHQLQLLPLSSPTPLDSDRTRKEVIHLMPDDEWVLSTCAPPKHKPCHLAARAAFLCRIATLSSQWRRAADALMPPAARNGAIVAAFATRLDSWSSSLAAAAAANGAARQFAAFARVNASMAAIADKLMPAEARTVAGRRYTEALQFWCCRGREQVKQFVAGAAVLQFQMTANWQEDIARCQRSLKQMERSA